MSRKKNNSEKQTHVKDELRIGPTKTHTDLHNGDIKYVFLLQ